MVDDAVNAPLLKVTDLTKTYMVGRRVVEAVRDVSFTAYRGETVGLVGESGSGKSTTGRCVLQLTTPTSGKVELEGQELARLKRTELRLLRRRMQMIFQDPYASLNPRMTILECVQEPLVIHQEGTARERSDRAREVLDLVGIARHNHEKRPRSFSGGQLQRVGIARALALNPDLIVCDEPVSALDVSIQAQVLNLLKDLQQEFNLTYVFISHDLAVIRQMCDHVCVMKEGKMVESGSATQVLEKPKHGYTRALLSSVVKSRFE